MEDAPEIPLIEKYVASTDFAKDAVGIDPPYISQDVQQVAALVRALDDAAKKGKKSGFSAKKTKYSVAGSQVGATVDSWRFQEWDYKRRDLPTYARGLFTTKTQTGQHEIAIRGYDKFFNVNEVNETQWDNIRTRTQGPYEITLKENGCIIFISGLEDETLLVCSKHSTGERGDADISHAIAGERHIERQLERIGKTKRDLARELRRRNVTAVAELCDDSFEEHILEYGPDKAGLYLHGINLNLPEFFTYPSSHVQQFAEEWGFFKTGLIVIDRIDEVQAFLEEVAESGAHGGRDVEGFVIRCKMTHDPAKKPFEDWFFKYKFEEPYLMYRQWRECTKSLIAGKQPRFKKHVKITEEYLLYARKRLAADRNLAKQYNKNHGIIKLRNDFLEFKNMKGSDAAALEEELAAGRETETTRDIILVPIATIGCGKTTLALGLVKLFDWGHVQNDNITGPRRPPRFTQAIIDLFDDHPVVFADRNNAEKRERKQIITDIKLRHTHAKLVGLNFMHTDLEAVRKVTQERVVERGDNHQTIQAATDRHKVMGIMEGFIRRFEPCDPERDPDDGFDAIIDLDPVAGSRKNLEIVVDELARLYPSLIKQHPTAEQLDEAYDAALKNYKPGVRHTIPDHTSRKKDKQQAQKEMQEFKKKAKGVEYMSVDVPTKDVLDILTKTFQNVGPEKSRFFKQLQGTRRVQPHFHVTLMHRAGAKEHPELWKRYTCIHEAESANAPQGRLDEMDVQVERVVFDNRVMAIVVRLVPTPEQAKAVVVEGEPPRCKWECVNPVSHITVGTRDDGIKPKESNEMLAKWLEKGSGPETGIIDFVVEDKPLLKGVVRAVLSK